MARELTLIFPHQLFNPHPAIALDREIRLIEDTLFFGDPHASPGRFHRQKILLHRASIRAFSGKLRSDGYETEIIPYSRERTVTHILETLVEEGFEEFHVCECHDFLLEKRLRRFIDAHDGIRLTVHPSPMFLTPRDWAEAHFESRKKPFMAKFYEAQRQRMNLLLDADGNPVGGRWSFDEENRKPMPKRGGLDIPPDPAATLTAEVKAIIEEVGDDPEFSDFPGNEKTFAYPVTHEAAEKWLEDFLTRRFDRFGPYEDAIAAHERILFHSVLTPMLNTGLLTPDRVLEKALAFAEANDTPLNSLEGFVRQLIGWREFMQLMYTRHGVTMRTRNFFGHTRDIPRSFWTGETGIPPIDTTIRRIHDHAYAHHIERLMLLGNFMLLCRFDPVQVNDWFMELFIDAYDWVMVPNVFGMSQFADGGLFTTKPYLSGSHYVRKMSDFKKGDWCEIWDGLFWRFIAGNEEFFRGQYRLSMMVRNLDKMDDDKKSRLFKKAETFLSDL
ncbi:MAG: cryptochrome/photolyase family protein [Verrucomicrobiales bacterium]|nr:cryptochrome/photolyase family protein [Verrucomicrobiales bacterium]